MTAEDTVMEKEVTTSPYKTADKTLIVHLHEDNRRDRSALSILEAIVERGAPVTVAFGQENVGNWLQEVQGDDNFYDRVKILVKNPNVDVALRRSISQRGNPEKEFAFLSRHFKTPALYCPHDGRINDEVRNTVDKLGIPKIVIPRLLAANPYRMRDTQIEVVTVTPLQPLGFGKHRFMHLDKVLWYADEVKQYCAEGLMPLRMVERVHFMPSRVATRCTVAANRAIYDVYRWFMH